MNDLAALALSAALVAAAFASSFILTKVSAPLWLSRKACHIIVSFWVFIMAGCFETTSARVIGPALFAVVNLVLSRTGASASAGIGKGEGAVFRRLIHGLPQSGEKGEVHDVLLQRIYSASALPYANSAPFGASSNTRVPETRAFFSTRMAGQEPNSAGRAFSSAMAVGVTVSP